ncbi:MAG: 30S ribosomal protein S2, partial [Pseudomonadota bacterium]
SGGLERLSKKEGLQLRRELEKLNRGLAGIKDMNGLPDAMFIIDVGHERIAVTEAQKLGIPVVAVVDSNNPPDGCDYIIPGNDDAIRSISLYAKAMADAILDARLTLSDNATGAQDEFVELSEEASPAEEAADNETQESAEQTAPTAEDGEAASADSE